MFTEFQPWDSEWSPGVMLLFILGYQKYCYYERLVFLSEYKSYIFCISYSGIVDFLIRFPFMLYPLSFQYLSHE